MGGFSFKTGRKLKYRKRAYNKKPQVAKAVKQAKNRYFADNVKKIIHRMIENKQQNFYQDSITSPTTINNIVNYSYDGTGAYLKTTLLQVSPMNAIATNQSIGIAQGNGQGDRIGNIIRTMKATLRFHIYCAGYDVTTNQGNQPYNVIMYIFKVKGITNFADLPSITSGNFFQNGDATSGFSGNISDYIRNVNKDYIVLHKRKLFKVGQSISNTAGTSTAAQYSFSNNDYKFNIIRKMDITKYLYKRYDYSDAGSPRQNATWVMFEAIPTNNSNALTAQIPVKVDWEVNYQYEDA